MPVHVKETRQQDAPCGIETAPHLLGTARHASRLDGDNPTAQQINIV
jgi:hypothetical protein